MRIAFYFLLSSFCAAVYGQLTIPQYSIMQDSRTHISVFHSGNTEKIRLHNSQFSDTLSIIFPDTKIKNGIVDHKSLTGEMLVREYYSDSILIGYLEFSGPYMDREIYFAQNGMVFLEKRYDRGQVIYTNNGMRMYFRKSYYP